MNLFQVFKPCFQWVQLLCAPTHWWVDGRWVNCTFEDFRGAFLKALFASGDSDGGEFRPTDMTNFGDLWLKLGGLALEYAFIIPSYYILVMRSFATFEGIAETVDAEFDIYSAAMPYAAGPYDSPIINLTRER